MNKRLIGLRNTRTKNKLDNNDNHQNQTDHLGLQQIELRHHNWSIFLSLLKPLLLIRDSLNQGRKDELKLGQRVEKALITSADKALRL